MSNKIYRQLIAGTVSIVGICYYPNDFLWNITDSMQVEAQDKVQQDLLEADRLLYHDCDYAKASSAYRKIIRERNECKAYAGLIVSLAKQKLWTECDVTVKRAKKFFAVDADLTAAVAFLCFSRSELSNKKSLYLAKSQELCEQVDAGKSNYQLVHETLGLILISQNRLKEACAEFRKVILVAPNPEVLICLARTLKRLHSGDKQISSLIDQAILINPKYWPAYVEQAKEPGLSADGSLQKLAQVPTANRGATWFLTEGEIFAKNNKYQSAIKSCKEALQFDPSLTASYEQIADYYVLEGREEQAVTELFYGLERVVLRESLIQRLLKIQERTSDEKLKKEIDRKLRVLPSIVEPHKNPDPDLFDDLTS